MDDATFRVPERERFPVGIVVDLFYERFYHDWPGDKMKKRATIMRTIYKRIEVGEIEAGQRCIGEPLTVPRAEVARLLGVRL